MQYVRSISGSVSKTWNSINPATLSGAIDVIVVEGEDGTLACSPFHVRFGKFSLLRPSEKKVEFRVHGEKQDYAMKLGDGGEAFFVFETSDDIPEDLQTSPLVSPASSPPLPAEIHSTAALQEPEFLDLGIDGAKPIQARRDARPGPGVGGIYSTSAPKRHSMLTPLSQSPDDSHNLRPQSGDWSVARHNTDELITASSARNPILDYDMRTRGARSESPTFQPATNSYDMFERSTSPPPLPTKEAIERAMNLSKQLSMSNIQSKVTETGDLMLDMTGYKSSDDDALRAEAIARKILSEELEGHYDIGALIGADENGNLWIYSSEEAKEAAVQRSLLIRPQNAGILTSDAASDPMFQLDDSSPPSSPTRQSYHRRAESDAGDHPLSPPETPTEHDGDSSRNYAKTLRLTSDQLRSLSLKPGANMMSFTVNRVTCQANMFLWKHETPIVISDIDGTITKSDALGHILNMIGRDWTHIGVAKLYTEIVANGYNIMYLSSRNVGQADTTRAYLNGVVQDGYRLPKGPTIMSPDRTIAALRREIYLRKPEVFKMACLRDIKNLFGSGKTPFYAGFGNRFTDALSYRSVSIPSNRIFTINSYAEVSLDLLSLNKMKLSYVNMREVVDHYFPPTSMLVKGGGEEFTDFTYWRDTPLDIDEFSASEDDDSVHDGRSARDDDDEDVGRMEDSYISQQSMNQGDEYQGEEGAFSDDYEDEEEDHDEDDDDSDDDETSHLPFVTPSAEKTYEQAMGIVDSIETDDTDETDETDDDVDDHEEHKLRQQDHDAEIITGMKTVKLEKNDSQ